MPDDLTPQLIRLISDGGLIGLLLVILIGGVKQWWVFGWAYRDKVREVEEWKTIALHGVSAAEQTMSLAEALSRRRPSP